MAMHELDNDPTIKLFQKTLGCLGAMPPETIRMSKEAIAVQSLSDRIGLIVDSPVIASPTIVGNQIEFQLNFLRFLWICTQAILVTKHNAPREK